MPHRKVMLLQCWRPAARIPSWLNSLVLAMDHTQGGCTASENSVHPDACHATPHGVLFPTAVQTLLYAATCRLLSLYSMASGLLLVKISILGLHVRQPAVCVGRPT